MKRFVIPLFIFTFALHLLPASAITATEEYVDRQDAATLQAAKKYADEHAGGREAQMLPKYLRALRFYDSYPDAAAWYYSRYARAGGACSSVRDGNTLARNYDWDFDEAPSWVIVMEAGPDRFGSVGVASVGTNLAAGAAIDGSPFYKALPGMTLDGVNQNGVAANINVVSSFGHTNGWHGSALHCLGAVRWVLDHATNAQHGAEFLAANVYVPQSMIDAGYSYHYMIADAAETWIAEDGQARMVGTVANRSVMTNFRNFDPLADPYGTGRERYALLENGGNITSAWFTLAYVAPGRESEFRAPGVDSTNACARAVASWATKTKEQHRGETFEGGAHWWQTVHTSVYDISNRVLRVAVQETDDWYTFAVPAAGGVDEGAVREIANAAITTNALMVATTNSVDYLRRLKLDGPTVSPSPSSQVEGRAADAKATGEIFQSHYSLIDTKANRAWVDDLFAKKRFGSMRGTVGTNLVMRLLSRGDLDLVWGVDYAGRADSAFEARSAGFSKALQLEDFEGTPFKSLSFVTNDYADPALEVVTSDGKTNAVAFAADVSAAAQSATAYTDAATNATLAAANAYTIASLTNADATVWAETSATNSLAYLATHAQYTPDPADYDFSNAVVSVALPIGTNELAVLREIGGLPLGEGAATIGGLLAALAAAVAWLKRKTADIDTAVGTANADLETALNGEEA